MCDEVRHVLIAMMSSKAEHDNSHANQRVTSLPCRQKHRNGEEFTGMQIDRLGRMHDGPQEVTGDTGQKLKDPRNNQNIFGGAMILLSGDFRQTLPIIPRSAVADELKAYLKYSNMWRHIKTLQMTTNMRVF